MSLTLVGALVVLALVDSTSFGTLLIPIWLMLTPGPLHVRRLLTFLGTVAGFYMLVGFALVAGLGGLLSRSDQLLDNPFVSRAQLVVGVVLFVWSFFIGRKSVPAATGTSDGRTGAGAGGRLLRLRDRTMSASAGRAAWTGVVSLALGAAVLEVATMLPYLAATGMVASADLPAAARVSLVAAYCLVMILPALVLLALRVTAHRRIEPFLRRVAAWMERTGAQTTAWVVGIVGFLLARDAVSRMPDVVSFLDGIG